MTDPELLILDDPRPVWTSAVARTWCRTMSVLANDALSPAIVLVSHHVEEVPAGFTHALMLRDARVVVSGPIDK